MEPGIFKSYDIRGKAPEEIDETVARRLGKVLSRLYQPKKVVVGHDMRETSTALEQALVEGFTASGVNVVRIGLCSTPMFNFSIGEAGDAYDLGVMVTASHNPGIYNGFKLTRAQCVPIGQGSGMEEVRAMMISEEPLLDQVSAGKVTQDTELMERYIARVLNLAALPSKLPAWRIAIDAGNGMNGIVLPRLTKRLVGMQFSSLYWEPDGTFPNHEANPLKIETLGKLRESVVSQGCAFGVAFDGDGDRVGFVDEQGTPIPGDLLIALFAKELLRQHPGKKVLYDLRASHSVPEVIREAGGEPLMCRVGHAHIKQQMREQHALFAGELSMHFYFSDLWNAESGDLAMLLLLKMMMREKKPLSTLWTPLKRYAHSGEINFTVKDAPTIIQKLEDQYKDQATAISQLDGLRMEFNPSAGGWWFNVRPSNTEPLLRLNLEARTVEEMERRKDELVKIITQ